jgi:hypothetical protein
LGGHPTLYYDARLYRHIWPHRQAAVGWNNALSLVVFAGMLPWTFFSTGLSEASNSLINNANLITKGYFPRLIVPTATVVVAFVDFLITFSMLIVLMAWYQYLAGWQILVLPAFSHRRWLGAGLQPSHLSLFQGPAHRSDLLFLSTICTQF